MIITINGASVVIGPTGLNPKQPGEVSYEEIVVKAGFSRDRIISVTYSTRRPGDEQRQGVLTPGRSTRLENLMAFNAADTSNS